MLLPVPQAKTFTSQGSRDWETSSEVTVTDKRNPKKLEQKVLKVIKARSESLEAHHISFWSQGREVRLHKRSIENGDKSILRLPVASSAPLACTDRHI